MKQNYFFGANKHKLKHGVRTQSKTHIETQFKTHFKPYFKTHFKPQFKIIDKTDFVIRLLYLIQKQY